MSNIVERLRAPIAEIGPTRVLWEALTQRREAADEIARLRAALQQIAERSTTPTITAYARRALEPMP